MTKISKHLFSLALVASLGFAATNATAATSTSTSALSFDAQGVGAFSRTIAAGFTDFNDLFTFTTVSGNGGASVIASFNGLSFSNGFNTFNLLDVTHGNLLVSTGVISSFVGVLGFSGLNSNTTYGVNVGGAVTNPGAGGFYSGSVTVAPVPELSEWLLMLSGLALIGFIATRRRSQGLQQGFAIA